ncbi:hypothetical protein NADE_007988 [Nannochloris sp. 'desiccata']|nr:hypothetical protein KSW81_006131 [Chlorella desiccata (nom. nud.)]KAH7619700.1 hypothetical protein NADE_007988 [Chlorella desiccata (nom. nud.)]
MGNLLSNDSTPPLYGGIKLLLADPDKRFPQDFNPEDPLETKKLKKVSRESFINKVRSEEGVGVVPLEEFSPEGIEEATAEEVELKDKATYIVIPRRGKSYEKRFESIETWQRNQTSGVERMLVARAIDELKKDPTHTNVRPWCKKKLTGPDGWSAEVDAVAIADGTNQGCAIIVEHKNVMDSKAALQLISLLAKIDAKKDSGEGTVAELSGLVIKGALAGALETSNPSDRKEMNSLLHRVGCYKWFEKKDYGDDPCSAFQASGLSCDAAAPTNSPGNGPTAPAAVPRRVGRLLPPMRGSAMLVRPRLANRVSSCRPSL